MIQEYVLITICRDEVAPRFDMTAEALLAPLTPINMAGRTGLAGAAARADRKHLVLAHASSEDLCDLITRSGVSVVVCGGIEEDYYHYLKWKRIDVISNVMGRVDDVLDKLAEGALAPGDCLYGKARTA